MLQVAIRSGDSPVSKYTLKTFQTEYPDDAACLDKVLAMRYGGPVFECPHCKKHSTFHRITKRRAYACQGCGHHIYPCAGTVFQDSRTKLTLWFYAMYLFTSSRHGVPAKELERQLGVTYKTAWRIGHELRKLMAAADKGGSQNGPLSGHVEVDEAYVGGKPRYKGNNTRGRGAANKAIVLGLAERNGNIRAGVVPNIKGSTLQNAIEANVECGSTISTDELKSYIGLEKRGFKHLTVSHGKGEYVRGDAHTNTIEGFWSRLKLSIRGTHIHVSKRHLWKYSSEFAFRYNMRKQPAAMFDQMIFALALPRLKDD